MSTYRNRRGVHGPPPGLDTGALSTWLALNLPDLQPRGELEATLFAGGKSNLTFGISDGARRFVLRRPPLGSVLETSHDMHREFRAMRALAATAVPVPAMYALCEDTGVIGAPFLVMEWVDGIVRGSPHDFAGLDPATASESAYALVSVLATLHSVDYHAVGLRTHGRPSGYLERQLRRWRRQWERSQTRSLPGLDELGRYLCRRLPIDSATAIVHGDFRYDNVIFDSLQPATIRAVVDWELSTLGDPLADLGFLLLNWDDRFGPLLGDGSSAGTTGFPTRDELAAAYSNRTGQGIRELDFYIGLAAYKTAIIFEGIHARYLAGHTIGTGFDNLADRVERLVDRGLETVRH